MTLLFGHAVFQSTSKMSPLFWKHYGPPTCTAPPKKQNCFAPHSNFLDITSPQWALKLMLARSLAFWIGPFPPWLRTLMCPAQVWGQIFEFLLFYFFRFFCLFVMTVMLFHLFSTFPLLLLHFPALCHAVSCSVALFPCLVLLLSHFPTLLSQPPETVVARVPGLGVH